MPNLIAQPRNFDRKVLVLKEEEDYGVDSVPTGLLNFVEARNVNLTSFEAETVDRNIILPWMGNGGKLITSIWSKLSFEIALTGAGAAGSAPKYSPIMLALGFAETLSAGVSATYNLISDGFSSASLHINVDGVWYKLIGFRGSASATINAKGIPVLKIDGASLYTAPVDGAMPAVDRTGWIVEDPVNSVNTGALKIGATDLPFSAFEWNVGGKVDRIDLPGPQKEVRVTNRAPTCSATVLAPTLAVFNPYALAEAGTPLVFSNTHGLAAGKKVKNDVKGKITNIAEDKIDGMGAYKLTITPEAVAGNDEITLTVL